MRIVFVGGFFPVEQQELILNNSKGVIQNAADAFQSALISGVRKLFDGEVVCINLPFIGGYPARFRKIIFPGLMTGEGKFSVHGVSFFNLSVVKIFSRFLSCLLGLMRLDRRTEETVIVYSGHMPFMLSALIYRAFRPAAKICIVLPDLPEFMGGEGALHSVFKRIDVSLFYWLVRKFNFFVVLTHAMIDRIKVDESKSVVVEGILGGDNSSPIATDGNERSRSFLYSGTLAGRYGIIELIDAFSALPNPDCQLWICGNGDAKDYVIGAASQDIRIKYFGQIARSEVRELQRKATFLVNPRMNDSFTMYSFPSKIMEYMCSGRPVIMFRLTGIPDEYFSYCICPSSESVSALSDAMLDALSMSNDEAIEVGSRARNFVIGSKSDEIQVARILNMITGDSYA